MTANLLNLLGDTHIARALSTAAEQAAGLCAEQSEVHLFLSGAGVQAGVPDTSQWPGRLAFVLAKAPTLADVVEDRSLTVTVPYQLLSAANRDCRYVLYRIGFALSRHEARIDSASEPPLFAGYYGITKRGALVRYVEHAKKAAEGKGSLLHSVWGSLSSNEMAFAPELHICGAAATLKEIYKMEEHAVQRETLTPAGLNAIPGGEAGIKMLHELALLKGRKVGIDERDAAVERLQQESPCAHYRRGHMRKLPTDKLTFVKPCWVNVK